MLGYVFLTIFVISVTILTLFSSNESRCLCSASYPAETGMPPTDAKNYTELTLSFHRRYYNGGTLKLPRTA